MSDRPKVYELAAGRLEADGFYGIAKSLRDEADRIAALEEENSRLRKLITEHNRLECIGACDSRRDHGTCDPYTDRGMTCPDCPREWMIDLEQQR